MNSLNYQENAANENHNNDEYFETATLNKVEAYASNWRKFLEHFWLRDNAAEERMIF